MPDSINANSLDELFGSTYLADQPGAAVIVTQNGEPIFRKGYGMANLELAVAIRPDMIFRIGSITKQFTAVAILMLMEEGKLKLEDSLEKFIPDYPVHGHSITVEHLLTHTSGIQGFTELPEFEKQQVQDRTTQEMLDFFKYRPMEFAPGRRWNYNNSAYYLLGVIIEKVSNLSYIDFLQQRIFNPLGMSHTYYDTHAQIIPNRASGYTRQGDQVINDAYISMTQPFSAGALASNVDDLAIWDEALYTDKLVSQSSLQRAWTPYRLLDGEPVHYGYGWALHDFHGHAWVAHGGGINGYLCYAVRLPQEHIYIAILTNTTAPLRGPEEVGSLAAAIALGQPIQKLPPLELPPSAWEGLAGNYQEKPGAEFSARVEEGKFKLTRKDWPEIILYPVDIDCFMGEKLGLNQLRIGRAENGQIRGFELYNIFGKRELVATKIEPSQQAETRLGS